MYELKLFAILNKYFKITKDQDSEGKEKNKQKSSEETEENGGKFS